MSKNLDKFVTKSANADWQDWVRLVKQAYKSKGYNLTQAQALIIAKRSYPGKGNVQGVKNSEIPVEEELIPDQPKRRPKPVASKEPPRVYGRSERRDYGEYPNSPPKEEPRYSGRDRYREEYEERRPSPPRSRGRRREEEYENSPPRRKERLSDTYDESPPRSRSRRDYR